MLPLCTKLQRIQCLEAMLPKQLRHWGVAKGSSISWVATLKGDNNSECKLSNGWSRSYKVMKLRSYREINQHPNLPWNFITHGFWISGPLRVSFPVINAENWIELILDGIFPVYIVISGFSVS